MKTLRLYNNIIGWMVFAVSSFVYLMTIEPTTSLWDCGEFIASAFKMQVGHPPGAPLFMITARFFSLFAGNDVTQVARMVNAMSGLASAFTVLFLFWTITHLATKIIKPGDEIKPWQYVAILGSALVGSLAYTFSDTFWFSAVEGEVYASSSLYTAVVFWAILKWENVADEKFSNRWLILIAYLMGLSIGVHLLNLLALPAIVLVYYFRKYKVSPGGLIIALIISMVLLGGIMYVIIPGVIWMASKFELLFVNGFGLPYNSGVLFYSAALLGGLIFGILYTHRNNKVLANTILLVLTVIILGYSSFSMIVIRSLADPPMNENSPKTVFALMYYLNREQYGDRPLLKGQYFNADIVDTKEGKPTYTQRDGRYVITNRKTSYVYNPKFLTIFPRMFSNDANHVDAYMEWANIKESDIYEPQLDGSGEIKRDKNGSIQYNHNKPNKKPSFGQNLKFFFKYQLGHMYFRYFMWNFSGRQNDTQGYGNPIDGNWISGIPFIDKILTGEQSDMPGEIKNIPSRNKLFMLPFLLGIIGLFYHLNKHKKDFWVVMVLFVMTGIAVVIYLNQKPFEPRERDYAYAGSFYAYAVWIGLGILGIIEWIGKRAKNVPSATIITSACLLIVPGLMARENWDDHDRSGRYTARDIAYDYLNSCAPNAILFTNGDNDTFPLWYAQEVEGIRTDVRVVNLMLLNMDWYIDQMKKKAYESEPIPISLKQNQYLNGTRDAIYIRERFKQAFPAKEIIEFIASDERSTQLPTQDGKFLDYVPSRHFILPVDTSVVLGNGTVKRKDANQIADQVEGTLSGNYLTKSDLIALDILANNNWERPVYYVSTGHSGLLGLENYLQLDGIAFRLVPIATLTSSYEKGRIDTDILYEKLMNTFHYGRMNEPDVYLDNFHQRTISIIRLRLRFTRLANALADEGDYERAEKVLDRIIELTPHDKVPYDLFMPGIAEVYYRINKFEKGNHILEKMTQIAERYLKYYFSLSPKYIRSIDNELAFHLRVLINSGQLARQYNQKALETKTQKLFTQYNQKYSMVH